MEILDQPGHSLQQRFRKLTQAKRQHHSLVKSHQQVKAKLLRVCNQQDMLRRANQYRPKNLTSVKDDLLTEMNDKQPSTRHMLSQNPSFKSLCVAPEKANILVTSESLKSLVSQGSAVNRSVGLPPLQGEKRVTLGPKQPHGSNQSPVPTTKDGYKEYIEKLIPLDV